MNVMITCGDSPIMKDVVALVKNIAFVEFIMLVDSQEIKFKHGANFVTRIPRGSSPSYLSIMRDLVTEFNIDHILVGSDEEALSLSSDKFLSKLAHLDTRENIELILNKLALYASVQNACPGIGLVPSFKLLTEREDLSSMVEEFGSVIVRPVTGRGSRGLTHVIDHNLKDDFDLAVQVNDYLLPKNPENYFITEFLNGDKFSVDCVFNEGQMSTCMIRNNGPLVKYKPPTMVADTSIDPDVYNFAVKIGSVLNLSGFHQIECAKDDEQCVKLIEINPRLDASLPITVCYSENFYELIITGAKKGLLVPIFSSFKRFLTSYKA